MRTLAAVSSYSLFSGWNLFEKSSFCPSVAKCSSSGFFLMLYNLHYLLNIQTSFIEQLESFEFFENFKFQSVYYFGRSLNFEMH